MGFFNFLRGFFGMPPEGNGNRRGDFPEERANEFRNPIWNLDDNDDDDDEDLSLNRGPRRGFSFHVDSNPFEIHRFFERQIEELMKSFGGFGFGNFGSGAMFSLEPPPMDSDPEFFSGPDVDGRSLRDQYLKPGYERDDGRLHGGKKMDSDLDDQVPAGEVGKILKRGPVLDVIEPERTKPYGGIMSRSFGRSMTSKTVTKANGGIEHHKTVRDSSGNEEVTVTRTIGSQSYSVTTKTNAQGRQERIENFINMEEGDLKEFERRWGSKL